MMYLMNLISEVSRKEVLRLRYISVCFIFIFLLFKLFDFIHLKKSCLKKLFGIYFDKKIILTY